jgi:hypothetical protein
MISETLRLFCNLANSATKLSLKIKLQIRSRFAQNRIYLKVLTISLSTDHGKNRSKECLLGGNCGVVA